MLNEAEEAIRRFRGANHEIEGITSRLCNGSPLVVSTYANCVEPIAKENFFQMQSQSFCRFVLRNFARSTSGKRVDLISNVRSRRKGLEGESMSIENFRKKVRDTFSSIDPNSLRDMKKEVKKILREKSSNLQASEIDLIAQKLRAAGVSDSAASVFHRSLMDEKILAAFKLLVGIRSPHTRTRIPKSAETYDEGGLSDGSSVPSGMDFYSTKRRPASLSIKQARLIRPFSECDSKETCFTAYIYNLPFGASEECIRDSLCNVGEPTEILVYDARGGLKDINRSPVWTRNSPIHGIVRFRSESEFTKATSIENKLFGVLCKSQKESRTMFLEPAGDKKFLFFSNYQSNTCQNLIEILSQYGTVQTSLSSDERRENMRQSTLLVDCGGFEDAFQVFRALRFDPVIQTGAMHFNLYRAKYTGKAYVETPHPLNFIIE
jgi:hypothetical protein